MNSFPQYTRVALVGEAVHGTLSHVPHKSNLIRIFFVFFSGQSRTMFGSVTPSTDLGAIPCAISWLYKGINERRQKSGARFSVRVSALGVSATKPGTSARDLLAAHATGTFAI